MTKHFKNNSHLIDAPTPSTKPDLLDRPLLIGLAILYAVIHLATLGYVYSLNFVDQLNISTAEMLLDRVLGWTIGFGFILVIVWFTKNMLRREWPAYRVIGVHLLGMLPITYVWYYVFNRVSLWFCFNLLPDCAQVDADPFYGYLYQIDRFVMTYLLVLAVTYTYYYLRLDNENRLSQSQLETKVLQAKMKMLRSQLHPHFLFNTLNSVTSLMDFDVSKAKVMIVDLADLLRKILDWGDMAKVKLSEELELLKRYVDIEKVRFSDDLQVSWDIDENLLDQKVPGMLLQPLVENTIQHGFSKEHLMIRISICAKAENDKLILSVTDDGHGFPPEAQSTLFQEGTGLRNTLERLGTLYQDNFKFTVENNTPGVRSKITLPLE